MEHQCNRKIELRELEKLNTNNSTTDKLSNINASRKCFLKVWKHFLNTT